MSLLNYLLSRHFVNVNDTTEDNGEQNKFSCRRSLPLSTLTCRASSSDNVESRVSVFHRYSLLDDGSLMIRDVTIADSGVYVCNASNRFGSDQRNGTLTVKRKTQIQTRPNNQEVRRGYSTLFRCTATADTSLTYDIDWYKDGQLLVYTGVSRTFDVASDASLSNDLSRPFRQGRARSSYTEDRRRAVRRQWHVHLSS
jgi:hypothetical protein